MNKNILKVNVTQSHIDKGKRGNCSFCPIALAVHDLLDKEFDYHIEVKRGFCSITKMKEKERLVSVSDYKLPEKANDFIWFFDYSNLDRATPFEMEMELIIEHKFLDNVF